MIRQTRRVLLASAVVLTTAFSISPVQAQDVRLLASVPSMGFPFFVHMMNEIKAEGETLGVEIVEADGQNSTPKQTADVEAAVIQGLDGILISPNDVNAMAPALQTAVENGVPVVTIDRRVDNVDGILAHVGADNVKGGEAQGQWIIDNFPDGARIVNLRGQPGASAAIDRNQGVHNVLDGVEGYEFIVEQTANFARDQGLSVTESILAGLDSPPDVIVAANDDMALGAVEAVRAQGLEGEIAILGFDALPEALAAVQEGSLAGTVEQFPGGQSRRAMQILVDFVTDDTEPAESLVLLTPIVITADNIDEAERLGELN
jgi:ABC-type sugar transport system substrate-binding protein